MPSCFVHRVAACHFRGSTRQRTREFATLVAQAKAGTDTALCGCSIVCDAFCTGVLCGALWCSVVLCGALWCSVVVLCAMFPCFSSGPGIPSDASRQAHLPGNSKSKSHHPTKSDQVDSRSIKSACLIGTV